MRNKVFAVGGLALMMLALMMGAVAAQDAADTSSAGTPYLGVRLLDTDEGVTLAAIATGSPADAAGLLIGDVVLSFNGEALTDVQQLVNLVEAAAVGDEVTLTLDRQGETVEATVTLIARPGSVRQTVDLITRISMNLNADLEAGDAGWTVVDTLNIHNPFALAEGDVITAVNGVAVADLTPESLAEASRTQETRGLTLSVDRDGETLELSAAEPRMGRGRMDHGRMDFFFDGMPFRGEMPFGGRFGGDMPFEFRFGEEGMSLEDLRGLHERFGERGGRLPFNFDFDNDGTPPDTDTNSDETLIPGSLL